MFEGVTAVEHAIGVMSLAGDAMLAVPEPARAPAGLGRIEEVGAVVTWSVAGRKWPRCRLGAARLDLISRMASSRIMTPPATAH
jgi:hypothetical protein